MGTNKELLRTLRCSAGLGKVYQVIRFGGKGGRGGTLGARLIRQMQDTCRGKKSSWAEHKETGGEQSKIHYINLENTNTHMKHT